MKQNNTFRLSVSCSIDEDEALLQAWKKSPCVNRSDFIKTAVNWYAILNKYSEEFIFATKLSRLCRLIEYQQLYAHENAQDRGDSQTTE